MPLKTILASVIVSFVLMGAAIAADLSGSWSGTYYYNDNRSHVNFAMEIQDFGGTLIGAIVEPNTFGDQTSQNLFANCFGQVDGAKVTFIKTYDGTGGESHSALYIGVFDNVNGAISGNWQIDRAFGRFSLRRN
jgi:hypothetical protein